MPQVLHRALQDLIIVITTMSGAVRILPSNCNQIIINFKIIWHLELGLHVATFVVIIIIIIIIIIECSDQRQVLNCRHRNLGCSSAEGRSSTANSKTNTAVLLGTEQVRQLAVAFRTPLSSTSEQTLEDLKRTQGHQRGGEESGFGLLGPPDFTEIHHRS